MRVLFFSNPLVAHLLPQFPLARALRGQGHTVAFSTAEVMAPWLAPEDFELLLSGPSAEEVTGEVARRTGADILFSPTSQLVGEYFAGARVDLSLDEALAAARYWEPDLILHEHLDFVGPLVAALLKLPSAAVATDPALEPDITEALTTAARARCLERGLELPSRVPSGRWLLDLCPPSLQRRGVLPPRERIALRPEPHEGPAGPPRARRAPVGDRPRVLVGLPHAAGATAGLGPILRSLGTLDVDLVATSPGDPGEGPGLETGRVELLPFTPAAELLENVSAVVHHGGSGSTFAAAARGIPAVVVPGSEAQQRQAEPLAAAGAGLVLPPGRQDPASVTTAVGRLLADPGFTVAAHRVRDEIAAMPSAVQVAEWLVASVSARRGR
ncbi:glycosyltransferase [Streptomyces sp. NPDC001185]|uniref:glycosyltransferase n=1 Tax=Streptomyces sp. NPDC001185 TaxID=3154380 RepID=UPI00331B1E84